MKCGDDDVQKYRSIMKLTMMNDIGGYIGIHLIVEALALYENGSWLTGEYES